MAQRITPNTPALPATSNRLLTNADFARLADVPPEIEWFANIDNAQTRQRAFRAYMQDRFDDYVVDLRKNDFDEVVYHDELQRQFRREAELVAGLRAQQEGAVTGQGVEDLHKYITLPAQQQ